MSQEILKEIEKEKQAKADSNLNPYTFKYAIQNNLNGIHNWLRPNDHKYYGEYL